MSKRHKAPLISVIFCLITLAVTFSSCQSNNTEQATNKELGDKPFTGQLPISTRIVKGQLENGIGYIIQKNQKPAKRAEIRLVVNIGSLAEDESQLGFAHFAEHMAFNGTEDFEKQQIVDYVQSIGMKFGAHLNAHTSFDETVYKLQIPTDEQDVVETGFHILENWAHKISFDPEEIDKERGVVVEELRSRKGAGDRIFKKQLPVLYKGSRYAERLPIGKQHILEHGKHEDLIRFYRDWYRPDLMSVVVVGDIEPSRAKSLIKKYFGQIKPHKNAKPKQTYTLPDNTQPLASIETDPELTRTTLSLKVKHPLFEVQDYASLKQNIAHKLFTSMLNNRIREAVLKPDAPLIAGGSNFSRMFSSNSAFTLGALSKPEKTKETMSFLLTEINRIRQNGFTATELERQKSSMLRSAEKGAKEIDKTQSRSWVNRYVSHYLKGTPLLDAEQYYAAYQHLAPQITLAEINQLADKWWQQQNQLLAISAPEKDQKSLIGKPEALALWQQSGQQKIAAYEDEQVSDTLLSQAPNAGSIISKDYNEELDAHIWTLSNQAKVILKVTDFKQDEILFSASSEGGNSLLDTDTYLKTLFTKDIVSSMGIGDFNSVQLGKFMKGKRFTLSTNISGYFESISGSSSQQDLTTFMQMLHLAFQPPRKDKEAFDTLIARATPYFEYRLDTPNGVFSEQIRQAQYGKDPRSVPMNTNTIQNQDFESSLSFYEQRFANAGDFNFAFVGNIDLSQMEKLVSTYIASLPSEKNKERFVVRESKRSKGNLQLEVEKGKEPKASVMLKFYGQTPWDVDKSTAFQGLKSVLSVVLRERIREEKSGVYGVRVRGGFNRYNNRHNLSISFTCDPERVDELTAEISQVIKEFKTQAQKEKYLTNYKTQQAKSIETKIKQNGFWRSYLLSSLSERNEFQTYQQSLTKVNQLTEQSLQQAANMFFNDQDTLKAVLLPEKKKQQ